MKLAICDDEKGIREYVAGIATSVNNPAPRRQTSADFLTDKEEIRIL